MDSAVGWLELAAQALVGVAVLLLIVTLALLALYGVLVLRRPHALRHRRDRRPRPS